MLSLLAPLVAVMPDLSVPFGVPVCVDPDAVPPGGLGGTFGGNPLSCAAAIAILDALEGQRPRAEQIGTHLRERLEAIAPEGSEVRGIGPMIAIELPERTGDETSRITRQAREHQEQEQDQEEVKLKLVKDAINFITDSCLHSGCVLTFKKLGNVCVYKRKI